MKTLTCEYCEKTFLNKKKAKTCSESCRGKLKYRQAKKENKSWYLKLLDSKFTLEKRQNKKNELIGLKGGKCNKCEYNVCTKALEFHHTDSNKEFNIGRMLWRGIDVLIKEVEKCDLLCSNCHIKEHAFYQEDRDDYQNEVRKFLYEKAGGRCSNCKTDDFSLLQFHHLNIEKKKFTIAYGVASRWSIRILVPEVNKCSLVCSNCHREVHAGFSHHLNRVSITQEDINEFLSKHGIDRVCRMCSNKFKTTEKKEKICSFECSKRYQELKLVNKFVNNCTICKNMFFTKYRVKVETPCFSCSRDKGTCSIEELKTLYLQSNYNMEKASRQLGISGNAIKKRLKKHFKEEWTIWQKNKKKKKN